MRKTTPPADREPADAPLPGRLPFFGLRSPCAACPFRRDVAPYLRPEAVRELERGTEARSFICHKTVRDTDYREEEEAGDGLLAIDHDRHRHCAGLLILRHRLGRPSAMAQIAERLGLFDPATLDLAAPVYESFTGMETALRAAYAALPGREDGEDE